jgi:hypothetical protein
MHYIKSKLQTLMTATFYITDSLSRLVVFDKVHKTQFVFWVVAPCSLVEVYQRFRGPCCLHHQGDDNQKTAIFVLTAVRASSPTKIQFDLHAALEITSGQLGQERISPD